MTAFQPDQTANFARLWRGRTLAKDADAYEAYLRSEGYAQLRKQACGVSLLRRDRSAESDFLVVSLWNTIESMAAFSGAEPREIRHLERDADFLIELPQDIEIFEIKASDTRFGPASIARLILASIAGSAVLFLAGYLIWGLWLGSYFSANEISYPGLSRDPPQIGMLYASNIVFGLLLTIVFERWAAIRTASAGLLAGALIGLLIHLCFELSVVGYLNLNRSMVPVAVDVIVEAARTSIAGAMVAVTLGWRRHR